MRIVQKATIALILTAPAALWPSVAPAGDARTSLKEARVNAARRAYQEAILLYREGRSRDVDRIYLWSQRWLAAQRGASGRTGDRVAACEAHWKRMQQLEDSVRKRYRAGVAAPIELAAVEFYRTEAELGLADAKEQ